MTQLNMFLVFFVVFFPVARLQKIQDPQEIQDLQDPEDFQDLKDLQDPQDLKDLSDLNDIQDFHDPWDPNDPLDPRDFQDPQNPQDLQDPQDFQDPRDLQERQDQDPQDQDQCPPGSCTPPLGDLMVGRAAQLSASSTCGLEGPENYCILGYLEEDQKCFLCDSRLLYSSYSNPDSHRVENLITTFDPDRKLRWWQSENGVHGVSVRLDLETVFQFSHLVLTFKSFRPAAMLVERSQDFGRSWKVFRYFSEDCSLHFPSVSNQPAGGIEDVVCDGRYSGPEPSTEGEVVLKALDPIFHIENPYAANVQDLITLTNIRVNFTRLFTLGDTLSRRRRNPRDKYYYAVYDMVVRGSCFCHGHAHRCRPVDRRRGDVFTQSGMVHGQCVCQHNTAGENCERCRDFHHDSPWRPGGATTAGLCRRCHCHGHSDSCHFDAARFEATGGASGGVCDACRHQRSGPECELCGDFLYRDPQRAPEDPHACIPCDCDPAGSLSGGLCEAASGRCVCKENIEGRRCDSCKPGFFNRRQDDPAGCQACGCHVLGSLSCDQLTGSCECDHLARGPLCDQCPAGFWGLGVSGYRCSPCDCDIGGAHSTTCSPEDGQCQCLPNMGGRRCSEPTTGHFLPPLDYFLYEAELAAPLQGSPPPPPPPPPSTPSTPPPPPPPSTPPPPTPSSSSPLLSPLVLPRCEQIYREQGYDFKVRDGVVVLVRRTRRAGRRRRQNLPLEPGHALQIIPRQRAAGQLITWTGLGFVRVLEGAGLRFTVDNLPSSMDYQLVIRYEPESPSDWLASISAIAGSPGNGGCRGDPKGSRTLILPGNSRGGVLDSPLCLNADARYLVDVVFNKQPDGSNSNGILIDSLGLIPSIESVQDFCSQTDLDSFRRFRCIGLATELVPQEGLPEVCEGLVKSMSARIHRGAVRCRCNAAGSLSPSCSKLGGVCECKPNVIGRCCDACAPLTFGFGPDGCQPCECHAAGSDPLCEQVRGQCSCRRDVAGRRCDRCRKGFWGFPLCRPCECNGLSDECEEDTGECVECREDAAGPHCDRCMEGFYGNPVSRRPCEPCLCPGVQGSGRFFATSCRPDPESLSLSCNCRPGHAGPRCDRCSPGFYGDLRSPGAGCEHCLCNNNIAPEERDACDAVTGVCQRCLHGTGGEHCQHCRAGYYGDALLQDCKECTCERRGTEVTRCPEGSPCVCDPQTGQCPCRGGVQGVLCDQCEDEYWNLGGGTGCQPCSCDTANAFSNTCNKVTGQCPCHAEFGGRQCDECGENHFGNPDLQCFSCDCNLEGTEPPSCDPETGECLCREGVSGIFCDECSPGYDSTFPLCAPCHACRALWAQQVEDVQRAAHTMRSFIPCHDDQRPTGGRPEQRMLQLQAELHLLGNLTGDAPPQVEQVEQLRARVGKLQDGLDQNRILMDPSTLLHTELDNIGLEFKKLLNNLKDKTFTDQTAGDMEDEEGLLDEIQNQHGSFLLDEKKVRKAITAVEESMDTRQEVKRRLSTCSRSDLEPLERRVLDLRVGDLNRRVCGASGRDGCSGCGGALCALDLGGRKCGGPNCDGAFPVSQEASETAEGVKDKLSTLPKALQDANTKIDDATREAQLTRGKAKDLQDQIKSNIDSLQREKDKTKELLQRVRDYLIDEMVPPEDIEKMARAVLDIKLPRPPYQIRSLINDINNLLFNTSSHQDSLENLEDHARTAQDLLKDARELKERTETVDLSGISRDLYEAERAQDKANDQLDASTGDRDRTRDQIQDMRDKLEDMETKLMSRRPEDLQDQIQALKEKTDQNRETGGGAGETAESAVKQIADTQPQLDRVLSLFEVLQLRSRNRKGGDAERLKNLLQEAEDMKTLLQDKLKQIQGIEQRMEELLRNRSDRAGQVSDLLLAADALRREIFRRAEGYAICTS